VRVVVRTMEQRFTKIKEGAREVRKPGELCVLISSDGRLGRYSFISGGRQVYLGQCKNGRDLKYPLLLVIKMASQTSQQVPSISYS
jgi:hypothetical protein